MRTFLSESATAWPIFWAWRPCFFRIDKHEIGAGGGDHVAEADAHVEDLVHLAVGDAGEALDQREDRMRLDQPVDLEADGRVDPRQVEQAVAGDVDERLDAPDVLQDLHRFRDIDVGRPQQLLAERGGELVELVVDAEFPALEEGAPRQ